VVGTVLTSGVFGMIYLFKIALINGGTP